MRVGAGRLSSVDVTVSLDAGCPPERFRPWVRDLDQYPQWLSIVPRADREKHGARAADERAADDEGAAAPSLDEQPAWAVELRAKLGPLARSKQLRMVRTVDDAEHVRFERREHDGRDHSPWVLDAEIHPTEIGSRLTMTLHYGGKFGGGVLERLLTEEIETSKPRLRALVEEAPTLS